MNFFKFDKELESFFKQETINNNVFRKAPEAEPEPQPEKQGTQRTQSGEQETQVAKRETIGRDRTQKRKVF